MFKEYLSHKKYTLVCETLCPQLQQSPKSYFLHKGQSQGHKVIDLDHH